MALRFVDAGTTAARQQECCQPPVEHVEGTPFDLFLFSLGGQQAKIVSIFFRFGYTFWSLASCVVGFWPSPDSSSPSAPASANGLLFAMKALSSISSFHFS